MPAALVGACCSAMPTSKVRSGYRSAKAARPVGCSIAAVTATTSARSAPMRNSSSEKAAVQSRAATGPTPLSGAKTPGACQASARPGAAPPQRVGEARRPLPRRHGAHAAVGVEDAGGVPGVDLIGLGRRVAEALGGDGVHDDRTAEGPRPAQRRLHDLDVVAVDRADVLQAEVLEHALRAL